MNAGAPSILDNATILKLDPNEIDVDVSGRLGFYFEDKARAFGQLIAQDGQRDLVKVSRAPNDAGLPWRLHVGLHRTMGARFENLPIYAIEVSGTPEQLAELEASENLHRRKLEPMERAKFVAAFYQAMQERLAREHGNLTQQQLAIKARWEEARNSKPKTEAALQKDSDDTEATIAAVYGWQESACDAFDLSKRSIRNAMKIFRQLIEPFEPELVRKLADHPVVGREQKQLLDLAGIAREDLRERAITILTSDDGKFMSAQGAMVAAGITEADKSTPEAKALAKNWSQVRNGWDRMGLNEQRRRIPELAAMLKTDGLKRAMRDRLNEELGDA